MSKRNSTSRIMHLAAAGVLCFAASTWGASRTIEITLTSLSEVTGEIHGVETYSTTEHEALSALKRAGDPALADCLLDAWEANKQLTSAGLTVREINTTITRDRYELNWHASFQKMPAVLGPLRDVTLVPNPKKVEEYAFAAKLALPSEITPPNGASPLGSFALTVSVRFPGTVNRSVVGGGKIDHTGECVSWTKDFAELRKQPIDIAATVTPGRASENRYWLILMITLTLLVGVIMFGLLRRGPKKTEKTT